MKKRLEILTLKKISLYGSILAIFLVFLSVAVPSKSYATGISNDYIDNVEFYYNPTDDLIFNFRVKTSFNILHTGNGYGGFCIAKGTNYYLCGMTYNFYTSWDDRDNAIEPNLLNGETFEAGITYTIYLGRIRNNVGTFLTKENVEAVSGEAMTNEYNLLNFSAFNSIGIADYEYVATYSETPTIEITFPHNNDEIVGKFNIQGNYYAPAGYDSLAISLYPYSLPEGSLIKSKIFPITQGQHDFSVEVSGIPAGLYGIYTTFFNDTDNTQYNINPNITFNLVNDIPAEIPAYGQNSPLPIPEYFTPQNPDDWYVEHSSFATPTAIFTSFSNSIAPVIQSVSENLYFFSSKFTSTNAKNTGEQLGNAITLARSYLEVLNGFFNNLPVGQFLLFYLIALIVIIVFRIIRNLINLIKI